MQFGRVEESQLDSIDFELPSDHPDNENILKGKRVDKPEIYFGCAKWGRKDWIGKLYPKGTKEKDFLKHYAGHFNSIELNPTHYNIPKPHIVERWSDFTGDEFKFCPKVFQGISHWSRLVDDRNNTPIFCDAIRGFGDKLGTTFLQLHPTFKPDEVGFQRLENYLKNWPEDLPLTLELRHKDWFWNANNFNWISDLLKERGMGFLITDTAGFRDYVHMRLTNPEAFIRFVGNSLHDSDYRRIDDWIERLGKWLDQGLERLYFFMHQHDELHSPELIDYMIKKMNKQFDLDIKGPKLLSEEVQGDLF